MSQKRYENSKYCHICWRIFCEDGNDKKYNNHRKVTDHDHYTGRFRGAPHSYCNLNYSTMRELPAISHNGLTYDYHFIIRELADNLKAAILIV